MPVRKMIGIYFRLRAKTLRGFHERKAAAETDVPPLFFCFFLPFSRERARIWEFSVVFSTLL